MAFLLVVVGLALLVAGGEALVRGAVALAERLGVSPLLIGLTVVGFGTSTPELVTSLNAALVGSPGIAIGNVVGSNTANILLILGIGALIAPIAVARETFRRDGAALAAATALCVVAVLLGEIGRVMGVVLVLGLVAYLFVSYLGERRSPDAEPDAETAPAAPLWRPLALAFGGIAVTILGARFLVDGSIDIARAFGLSEAAIGLTIVAVGTSMPELVTTVMAALRRQSDIAFGNVIGSNIYNVLGILGVTGIVSPLAVPPQIASLDIWVMVAATLLLVVFATTGRQIARWEGGVFVGLYVAYTGWLLLLS